MVLRGGENVYCAEVEAAIYEHPDVAEAAVFGVPDDRLGETVGAAIYLAESGTLDESGLAAHLAPLIAKFKQPRSPLVRRRATPTERQRQVRETPTPRATAHQSVVLSFFQFNV